MDELNIGVIGAGRIGKLHIENVIQYLPSMHIKYILDPAPDTNWLKKFPKLTVAKNLDTILEDNEIHAVFICSPASLHVPQIIAAARAGKHIFCEKPIATEVAQIEHALREVKQAKVHLQVGFNRRFDPNFAKIKQMLREEVIGTPHMLRITSRDPEIPSAVYLHSSSGMFLDMTIHDFDMARFLMDSEITEVYASANVLIDPIFKQHNDIDTAIINLKFANGSLGVIDNSRQAVYGYDQRIEVFGSLGSVCAENNKPTNTIWSTRAGVFTEKPVYFFLERYKESYISELREFHASIVNDVPPSVSGKDGLLSVVVGLSAQISYLENRPIRIDHEKWNTL